MSEHGTQSTGHTRTFHFLKCEEYFNLVYVTLLLISFYFTFHVDIKITINVIMYTWLFYIQADCVVCVFLRRKGLGLGQGQILC